MSGRFCVSLLLSLCMAATLMAQSYHLSVRLPGNTPGVLKLSVYEGSEVHAMTVKSKNGFCEFTGQINQGAAYAELKQEGGVQLLPFFIENSDISVRYDAERPMASPIVGSRSNSQFRYALEYCGGNLDSLVAFVCSHPSEVFTPYLLFRYVAPELQRDALANAVSQLQGAACKSYHYGRLLQRLERMDSLAVGRRMPDFQYVDGQGHLCSFHAVRKAGAPALIWITAAFCAERPEQEQQAELQQVVVRLEDQPLGWNAPLMEQLLVDHLPYCILLNGDGRIVATDVRTWELEKFLKQLH